MSATSMPIQTVGVQEETEGDGNDPEEDLHRCESSGALNGKEKSASGPEPPQHRTRVMAEGDGERARSASGPSKLLPQADVGPTAGSSVVQVKT